MRMNIPGTRTSAEKRESNASLQPPSCWRLPPSVTTPRTKKSNLATPDWTLLMVQIFETFSFFSKIKETTVEFSPEQKPILLGQCASVLLCLSSLWMLPNLLGSTWKLLIKYSLRLSLHPAVPWYWLLLFRGRIPSMLKQTWLFGFLSDCTVCSLSRFGQLDHKKLFVISSKKC